MIVALLDRDRSRGAREYVAQAMLRTRDVFVPLSHRPGHAHADFGEADVEAFDFLLTSILYDNSKLA
jgi:hypothetical protein